MEDREQRHSSSREPGEKRQSGTDHNPERMRDGGSRRTEVEPGGTVGRTVPDESKEHHTEIAVEAGHKGGNRPDNKR